MRKYLPGADFLRIISGFGVVLIHVTDPFLAYPPYVGFGGIEWWAVNIINTSFRFSVPVFIMLSGYLLLTASRNESFETFYKKRLFRVGAPFAFWLVVYFVWQFLLGARMNVGDVFLSILTVDVDYLYFLFIIVELYFLTPVLLAFNRGTDTLSHKVFAVSASAFTMLVATSGAIFSGAEVVSRNNVFAIFVPFISYFYLGYFLRGIKLSLTKSIWAINIFLNLLLITVLLSNGVVTSFVRQYGSPNIFLMSVIVFILFLHASIWDKIKEKGCLVMVLKHISSCIFGIYLVHMVVISTLNYFFSFSPGDVYSPMWVWVVVKVFIVFGISYFVVAVGKKIPKVGILFG